MYSLQVNPILMSAVVSLTTDLNLAKTDMFEIVPHEQISSPNKHEKQVVFTVLARLGDKWQCQHALP